MKIQLPGRFPSAKQLNDETLTLRQLRDRLSAIIDEHDRRGWSERNNQPVVLRIPQPSTPTGRRRDDVFVAVARASSGSMGLPHDDAKTTQCTELVAPKGCR